jgi:hypothetical protein
MTKIKKVYDVVIQYDVQRTYTVLAKNQEQAEKIVRNGYAISHKDHWLEIDTLEVKEVA